MKQKKTILRSARAALLLVALLTTASAWALGGGETLTNYQDVVDNSFVPRQKNAKPLTGEETMLDAGWYVVNSNISFNHPIQLLGDVNIILADDCTMTMGRNENRIGTFGIYGSKGGIVSNKGTDYDLHIYGQSEQTGVLDIWGTTNSTSYACIKVQDLSVYGGNINLRGCNGISTRGQFDDNVNIYRGTVNITTSNSKGKGIDSYYFRMFGGALNINGSGEEAIYSNRFAMSGGTLSVYDSGNIANDDASSTFEMTGGQLYVNGTNKGISANTVTLGLTQDDDLIEVNNYYDSNVQVATGKVMMDATNPESPIYYTGTLTTDQKAAIAGKVLKTAQFKGTGTQEAPYTIYTTAGWNTFCSMITQSDNGLVDIFVKLGSDISVTTMAGTSEKPFCGTFDGDGHTLTVDYHVDEDYIAPFRFTDGATIQNLNVEGIIYASAKKAAGIIGVAQNNMSTITNCRVGVYITGGNETGGFVATGLVEIDHCVFNGSFESSYNYYGFVGNSISVDNIIKNCLFDPQPGSAYANTYYTGTTPQILNCYYSEQVKADNKDDGQAKLAHRIIADALVKMTLKSSNTNGVQFGSTCYAAKSEVVSLTLADPSTAHTGYTASLEGYSATAGNLSGSGTDYTLTMPEPGVEVFISCYSPITYDITYYPGEGATFSQTKYNYNVESEDIVLDTPTKEGSRFMGWYTNGEYTGSPVTTIPKGSTDDKVFYAKWEAIVTPANKDLGRCAAMVPNPTYHQGYTHSYFYDGTWNDNHGGIKVYDGDTELTYYHYDSQLGDFVGDYRFSMLESLDGGSCENLGEHCRVTLTGMGDYAGTLTADVVIISETANGTWGDNLSWSLSEGTLTITGSGAMQTAGSNSDYPWYPYGSYITTVILDNNITTIPAYAFAGASQINTYAGVTTFKRRTGTEGDYTYTEGLPTSLTSIGDNAFAYCINAKIIVPTSVTTFGTTTPFNQVGYYDADADEVKGGVFATLSDTGDNNALIGALSSARYANVTINRTLYKDGDWNTLCLPFSMSTAQVATQFEGCTLMELDVEHYYDANLVPYEKRDDDKIYNGSTEYSGDPNALHQTGYDNGTLYLYFKEATSITAGKPYIIKWSKPNDYVAYNGQNAADCSDITSLTFNGVRIEDEAHNTTSPDGKVSFKGTYAQKTFTDVANSVTEDKSILFLGASNKLYYPISNGASDCTLNAFRAYFQLNNGLTVGNVQNTRMNFGDENESTCIKTTDFTNLTNSDAWYTIDGRKLSAKPTAKGMYINGNKKIVIK